MKYLTIIFTIFLLSSCRIQTQQVQQELSNDNHESLKEELVESMEILDTLILHGTSFPTIDSIKNVSYLELYDPEFGNLPKDIAEMQNLKYIGLATNINMTELPPEIGELINLQEIEFIKPFGLKTSQKKSVN